MRNIIKQQKLSEKQIQESGIVLVICFLFIDKILYPIPFVITLVLLLLTLLKPIFFKPFAFVWFSLSEVLGGFVQKIFLVIVFYFVVCPIGFLMNLFQPNEMRLSRKQMEGKTTAFISRNYKYTLDDLKKPF